MVPKRLRSLSLSVALASALVIAVVSVLAASPTLAKERTDTDAETLVFPAQPPSPKIIITVFFTDPTTVIEVTDLAGNVIGEGQHGGELRCTGDNCNRRAELRLSAPGFPETVYEYKFSTRQAFDPDTERVVVAGTGRIVDANGGKKEEFSFTATYQNNRDGTVWTQYLASTPDASFIVPRSPGTFVIQQLP